jgi:hypothetical protein
MRKALIASSVAALAIAGLAGGAVYAAGDDAAPAAAPTTTIPGSDIFADMGLTPEQSDCLVANVGGIDMNDLTALMELMTQCGISTDQLLQIGEDALETTLPGETATTTALPAEIDPATAAAALALFGLDQETIDCLVAEASVGVGAPDDATAELAFFNCEVGMAQLLAGIIALDTAASGAAPADSATVTVAAEEPAVTSGNAMVDLLLEQLAAQGINLDAEQGQCLLDNISDLDPNDMSAMLAVFETCGIEIADLLPSG